MKMPMTERIQSTIIAVQDYKKHLISYHVFALKESGYDWFNEVQKFYYNLPLPNGMDKSYACFEAILRYPIKETMNTEMDELSEKFSFGY